MCNLISFGPNYFAISTSYSRKDSYFIRKEKIDGAIISLIITHVTFYNRHSEIGNFQEAIAHYLAALSRNPAYVEAYCNIGVIYKNFGNLEMAIHYYEQALNVNPNFRIARNNMAIALTDLGTKIKNEEYDLPRAMQLYKRVIFSSFTCYYCSDNY